MSQHKVKAYAAYGPKEDLKVWEFEQRTLEPDTVEIKVTHCGVCHSDVHTVDGDWGEKPWPVVPGHEIVGTIVRVGENVKNLKVGMRVGVGPQGGSCHSCRFCNDHVEQYCPTMIQSYGSKLKDGYITKGGFSAYHIAEARFAIPIPENLPSDASAPLLCAGITLYSPLKRVGVKPGMKVAIVGLGGLGHIGVKLAAAMGAEVTVVSSSLDKKEEALKLGATHFLHSRDESAMKEAAGRFDAVLNTVSADLPWSQYLALVATLGTFVVIGAPPVKMQIPPMDVLFRGLNIMGSLIGSPDEIAEMFELCGKHNIVCQVETVDWSQVNYAIKKVKDNTVRYRMVLKIADE